MKRKIYISLLTLLFFVSTTALPLTMHLCTMNSESEMCAMCSSEVEAKSCCEETIDDSEIISQANNPCCEIKVVDPSVKDNFITFKTEFSKEISILILSDEVAVISQKNSTAKFFYDHSSPPSLDDNHIYLINSTFLI